MRHSFVALSLPPWGGSGLKLLPPIEILSEDSLPPWGGSGLKYTFLLNFEISSQSPSLGREWIEMFFARLRRFWLAVSLLGEGVD